jgi:uncharacterized protein YceK
MKWIVVGLLLSLMLDGCATVTRQQHPDAQRQALATQPRCISQRQCEAAWSAAIDWVNHNCGVKIQSMTDSYVETYQWFDTSLACRLTKDPDPRGGYSLNVTISCRNMIGCVPDVHEAERTFNAEVKGAADQFAGP